ncbi:MAG: ABC transporter permease [Culicoidibacterales bacterium]
MGIFENIKMAFISIWDNKLRSFLTMISIIIGIASVIAIVSIGRGATSNLLGNVLEITNGQLIISYRNEPRKENENPFAFDQTVLDQKNIYIDQQIDALENLQGVETVVKTNTAANVTASYREKETKGQQLSTTMSADQLLKDLQIVDGRIFTEAEFNKGIPVLIIHQKSARNMFGESSEAIGKELIINNKIFLIVGTYREISAQGQPTETFYLPYKGWIAYSGSNDIQQLAIVPQKGEDLKALGKKVVETLDKYKVTTGEYEVLSFDAILKQAETLLNTMTLFVTMIAAISLLVGGIGVMNIMYVSVVERTHEIGLRKAIGATGRQILLQFLIESVTITTIGGIIGIVIGLAGHSIGAAVVKYPLVIYTDIIIIGVGFSMGIGLLFGTLPAAKAAKMPPIEALRNL